MRTTDLTNLYEQKGPFASVALDVSHNSERGAEEHRLHAREVRKSLLDQGADQSIVDAVTARIEEQVSEPAPVARVVVANADGVVFDETIPAQVNAPAATWSPLPDLDTWVEHQDARFAYVLALVDHEGGDVGVYYSDVKEPEEETTAGGETEHVHKVRTGGWSSLRYQHVSENVWRHNAQDVAEAIKGHARSGVRLVLLGGDPYSRSAVADALDGVPAEVVHLEHAGRADDGGEESLWQAVREALVEQAVARRLRVTQELKERLGREGAVATGVRDVADAFVRGQVETLLIDPVAASDLTLSPSAHPGLDLGAAGEPPEEDLRADLALVAAATRTGADVSIARRGALGGAPVAALLRWG